MSNEELVTAIQNGVGVKEHTEQLWEKNTGLITSICAKYSGYTEMDDLLQESFFALLQVVKSYDPEAGQFSTYFSHVIEWQLIRYLQSAGKSVHIPVAMNRPLKQYRKTVEAYRERFGQNPSDCVLCKELKCSPDGLKTIRAAYSANRVQKSLYEPIRGSDDEDIILLDMVPDSEDLEEQVTEKVFLQERAAVVWEIVDSLPEAQAAAIRWRYQTDLTFKQISERMGVKESAYRTLHDKGMRSLKHGKNVRRLRRFWEETSPFHSVGVQAFNRTWTSATEALAIREIELSQRLEERMKKGEYH